MYNNNNIGKDLFLQNIILMDKRSIFDKLSSLNLMFLKERGEVQWI